VLLFLADMETRVRIEAKTVSRARLDIDAQEVETYRCAVPATPGTRAAPTAERPDAPEVPMTAFIIQGQNRPGELARICEAIAKQRINITSLGSVAWGTTGAVGVLTEDDKGTRDALATAGVQYKEVETVEFGLADKPGTLAEATRKLANAGVNIEFLVPTGMRGGEVQGTAGVDNAQAARQALGTLTAARA
jgi:hypothetical protein